MVTPIELIVGLGNPGPEHLITRHNAGFWFADLLVQQCNSAFRMENRFHGEIAEVNIENRRIRILKPMTYMNDSGRSIAAIITYFKMAPEKILVVYDELDLVPGRVQLKFDGGHGGHNGLRSIFSHIGKKFWRLRLGIGHPGHKQKVASYVLKKPSAEDRNAILDAALAAIETLPIFLNENPERAKTKLHSRGIKTHPSNQVESD
ncbi:MAG: aminoacyl-tRNA hydrolase [Rhodospirillaceae bacterium]|nr:aminoacyl-tRNA hydrolase [Rhodospirillaceae bacterium]